MTEIVLTVKDSGKGKALLEFLEKIDFIEIRNRKVSRNKSKGQTEIKFPSGRIKTKSFRFDRDEVNER